jgi:hypothetical protein
MDWMTGVQFPAETKLFPLPPRPKLLWVSHILLSNEYQEVKQPGSEAGQSSLYWALLQSFRVVFN